MDIKSIMDVESAHLKSDATADLLFTIWLFPSSSSFLQAYEWSAWLLNRYCSKPPKPTRRKYVEYGSDLCKVGFPVKSLATYTPVGAIVTSDPATGIFSMSLPESIRRQCTDFASMHADYQSWHERIPLSDKSNAEGPLTIIPDTQHYSKFHFTPGSLADQLLVAPIDLFTPLDAVQYLVELRLEVLRRRNASNKQPDERPDELTTLPHS